MNISQLNLSLKENRHLLIKAKRILFSIMTISLLHRMSQAHPHAHFLFRKCIQFKNGSICIFPLFTLRHLAAQTIYKQLKRAQEKENYSHKY